MAEQGEYEKKNLSGEAAKWDFMEKYCQLLRDYIKGEVNKGDQPLAGLDIVVDAGNGSGGFFPEKVLKPLGADTSGGIYLNPDGHFPNHAPNPESTDAMMAICRAVTRHHADLGIIFDTDVDRSAIVDHYGDPINRNSLIALIAAIILREHPGTTIVTDSVTSEGLAEFIKAHGGKHHRFKRGYRNVIDEAIRLNNEGEECWLAIETSGHAALRENYFLDDGAYLVAKLITEAARMKHEGKELSDLIHDLKSRQRARRSASNSILSASWRKARKNWSASAARWQSNPTGTLLSPTTRACASVARESLSRDGSCFASPSTILSWCSISSPTPSVV